MKVEDEVYTALIVTNSYVQLCFLNYIIYSTECMQSIIFLIGPVLPALRVSPYRQKCCHCCYWAEVVSCFPYENVHSLEFTVCFGRLGENCQHYGITVTVDSYIPQA